MSGVFIYPTRCFLNVSYTSLLVVDGRMPSDMDVKRSNPIDISCLDDESMNIYVKMYTLHRI